MVAAPTAPCPTPTIEISAQNARPSATVTVTGHHFSGCAGTGANVGVRATALLPVQIGVQTAMRVSTVLANTTDANGSVTVTVTVPAAAPGSTTLTLGAAARDTATTITYAAAQQLPYSTTGLPTGVPARTGGQGASTAASTHDERVAALLAGLVVLAAGSVLLARSRRARS